jgi:glycosyltransferase involved in cell wall biosynthesis
MSDYTFTVFTATFNRAHTLHRPYASLAAQTCRDFEWIVIDDGSTDDTPAKVGRWRGEAPFPIVYERQENRGKHIAHNRAAALARGSLFVILDSDDELVPEALERFRQHWNALGEEERRDFLGVVCLCRDAASGRVLGRRPRAPVLKVPALEYVLRERVRHDLAACVRVDLLREHPFPEVAGAKLLPEGAIWARFMRRTRMVVIDEVLEIKHYERDGYTRNLVDSYRRHAPGRYWYFLTNLSENADLLRRFDKLRWLKDAVQLGRMMFHAGRAVGETRRALAGGLNRAFFVALLPLAWLLYRRDLLVTSDR